MPTTSHRRWFQFSLRSMFVLVALLAMLLGRHMQQVNRQRDAVARTLQRGGRVTYDYQLTTNAKGLVVSDDKGQPGRLADWIGIDHVRNLRGVDLRKLAVTDDDMRVLVLAPTIEGFDFGQSQKQRRKIPDEVLHRMMTLPDLRRLNFSYTDFDDRQLEYILCHTNLRLLQLSYSFVTDAGLERLAELAELEWLDLTDTSVTDRGLQYLGKLKKLNWFIARGKGVTPDGVQRLKAELPNATIIFP